MRSLSDALDPTMTIRRVGRDRYGRTLALIQSRKGDLSCWQMRTGNAQYRADWDNGARVRRTCSVETQ
jgi:endonuclease YncB( thermonuclease family)